MLKVNKRGMKNQTKNVLAETEGTEEEAETEKNNRG